tara:strand:+ start:558 stop:746 length:189 start_codon:yes stop_codon:yes gene_type:complete
MTTNQCQQCRGTIQRKKFGQSHRYFWILVFGILIDEIERKATTLLDDTVHIHMGQPSVISIV